MIIDVGVATSGDLQIQQAMAGKLMKHVIEEGHPGSHIALPRAIKP